MSNAELATGTTSISLTYVGLKVKIFKVKSIKNLGISLTYVGLKGL